MHHHYRFAALFALIAASTPGFAAAQLSPAETAALDEIRASRLRGDVSFLASDLLEGRATPSRGLDIAAEYIAARFRSIGLEPMGDNGTYFQIARYLKREQDLSHLEVSVGTIKLESGAIRRTSGAVPALENRAAFKIDMANWRDQLGQAGDQLRGRVVLLQTPNMFALRGPERAARRKEMEQLDQVLREHGVPLAITMGGSGRLGPGAGPLIPEERVSRQPVPVIAADSTDLRALFDAAAAGPLDDAQVSVKAPAARYEPVGLRNVAAILRGAGPEAVLVTAHYDHLGMRPAQPGAPENEDRINNGANDDASGVASTLAVATALARLETKPRRSVIFVAFFGEELGLLGAEYWADHPAVPLDAIVANLNLEHMGRTDPVDGGPHVGTANLTGYGYSTLHTTLEQAAAMAGINLVDDIRSGNGFFTSSDNEALAQKGVVAHTISVAYIFPDYHRPGDEWPKLDYDNMAKVDRWVATAVMLLDSSTEKPRWSEDVPATAAYREAATKRHAAGGTR
jgi:hypothetical protein